MAGPFPGMDPWLEHPDLWPDVHNSLIAALRTRLSAALRPAYFVRLEERTVLSEVDGLLIGRPDLSTHTRRPKAFPPATSGRSTAMGISVEVPVPDLVRETWLQVQAVGSGEVIAIVEVLSATNKKSGSEGRSAFLRKRLQILGTQTHLVEIDLLRGGEPMPIHGTDREADYRILISRGDQRPHADLLLFSVRDPIPAFSLPLRAGDAEPVVDLGATLAAVYDDCSYDLMIDYSRPAISPLPEADAAWAQELRARA